MNKASGGDGIPAELIKILKDATVKVLHSVCHQIWKTQQWPQDWKRSVHSNSKERQCQRMLKLPIALISHAVAAAASLQLCPTLCDTRDSSPPGSPLPGPGKNTGVGCHFLLQYMKVKSESEVAQSCPTLSHPMDCSPPGSSIHGICQARVLEWGAIAINQLNLIILSTTLT